MTPRAISAARSNLACSSYCSETAMLVMPKNAPSIAAATVPMTIQAQTSGQTTTQSDAKTIWEKIKGSWTTSKGAVKEQWGKLTDDQLDVISGNRDQLVGKIQESYGIAKDEAEKEVKAWESTFDEEYERQTKRKDPNRPM